MRWEGSVKGISQKTCHFALYDFGLQVTGEDQNSFLSVLYSKAKVEQAPFIYTVLTLMITSLDLIGH